MDTETQELLRLAEEILTAEELQEARNRVGMLLDWGTRENVGTLEEMLHGALQTSASLRRQKTRLSPPLHRSQVWGEYLSGKAAVNKFLGIDHVDDPRIIYHDEIAVPQIHNDLPNYNFSDLFVAMCGAGGSIFAVLHHSPLVASMAAISTMGYMHFATKPQHIPTREPINHYRPTDKLLEFTGLPVGGKYPREGQVLSLVHEYTHHVVAEQGNPGALGVPSIREGHAFGVERHIAEHYAEKEDNPEYLIDRNIFDII
ncbi:hypothetical protein HZB01_02030 [Candidatus Woesearchaeota archaeon]|nr:hypothetical protein [Candidatus Woesearchaeota archaeon]